MLITTCTHHHMPHHHCHMLITSMAHTFDLFATKDGDPENVVQGRAEEWKVLQHMLWPHT